MPDALLLIVPVGLLIAAGIFAATAEDNQIGYDDGLDDEDCWSL